MDAFFIPIRIYTRSCIVIEFMNGGGYTSFLNSNNVTKLGMVQSSLAVAEMVPINWKGTDNTFDKRDLRKAGKKNKNKKEHCHLLTFSFGSLYFIFYLFIFNYC